MVGASQVLLEGLQSMMQDGLTGGEKVITTFAFLPYSLFLQFLHKPYMFPMECHGPRRPHDGILTKGLGIGNLRLLELVAPNCLASWMAALYLYFASKTALAQSTLASRTMHKWRTLAFSLAAASLASFSCSCIPSSQVICCLLRSVDLFTESMWLVARLASILRSVRSTIGLPLWLLYAAKVRETLTGLLSREASPSSRLA